MLKQILCYCQYILPQHLLSTLVGKLANSRKPWIKNYFIDYFCRKYAVDLSEASIENAHDYPTFNSFFTRPLKPGARPIDETMNGIVSPADGCVAQLGKINGQQLLQAKNMYFNLSTLFGGRAEAGEFANGNFATIYLAPHNYHRVHMPVTGTLRKSIYIPGNLFSVNRMTSELIPNLYARNERLVMIFDTTSGPAAVILVGALICGSMQTVWMKEPLRSARIEVITPTSELHLTKGAELGRFQLGSTVIMLFPSGNLNWVSAPNAEILTGQLLATLN